VTKHRPGFALARATIIGLLVGGVLIGLVGVSAPVAVIIAIAVAVMVVGFRAWARYAPAAPSARSSSASAALGRPARGGGPMTARFLVAFAVLAAGFIALLVTTSVTAALAAISAVIVVLGVVALIQRPAGPR
jgi:hypothetical protein